MVESLIRYGLLNRGHHVLVAVSGGADSVALLYALRALAPEWRLRLTAAHLNHRIRGKDAEDDAAFVKRLARQLGVDVVVGQSDVPRAARTRGISIEMAARNARYRFLARAARGAGADVVATAHTADDQAETLLLKLARGTGLRGLTGIPRKTVLRGVTVVRPLLGVTRNAILAFLQDRGAAWREDASNRDTAFLRNRVRHEVLPFLETRLNPRIREALVRMADVLTAEDQWLDTLSASILSACRRRVTDPIRAARKSARLPALDADALREQPLAARRRVVRLWLVSAGVPPEAINFDSVERVDGQIRAQAGSSSTPVAAGVNVRRRRGLLVIEPRELDPPRGRIARQTVAIPGTTRLSSAGLRVKVSVEAGLVKDRKARLGLFPAVATIRAGMGRRKLIVRSWQPGDRMKPLGMNGSKKLHDIFVDAKVPAEQRHAVPVFECAGEIVWLPGYRVSRGWEVWDPAQPSLQIRVEEVLI